MTELIKLLAQIKMQYPSLRLGQIIVNACPEQDIFYVEDKQLLANLKATYPLTEPTSNDA